MTRVVAAARAVEPRAPSATQASAPRQTRGVASIDEAITRFLAKLESEPVPEAAAALASPAANAPASQPQTPWLVAVVADEPAAQDPGVEAQSDADTDTDAESRAAALPTSAHGEQPARPEGVETGVFPTLGGAPLDADPAAPGLAAEEKTPASATASSSLEGEAPPSAALRAPASDDAAAPSEEAAPEDASAEADPEARAARALRERGDREGSGEHSSSREERGERRVTASFERVRDSAPPPKATDGGTQAAALPKSEATRTLTGVGAGVQVVSLPLAALDTPASPLASAGEVDAGRLAEELEPEVTEALSRLRSLGEGRATVRLEHPSLGSIRVDLSLDGDAVDVRLVAATSSAAIALRASERALRDAFGSRAARLRYRVSTRGPHEDEPTQDSSSSDDRAD